MSEFHIPYAPEVERFAFTSGLPRSEPKAMLLGRITNQYEFTNYFILVFSKSKVNVKMNK
jgi:hypothetical protein